MLSLCIRCRAKGPGQEGQFLHVDRSADRIKFSSRLFAFTRLPELAGWNNCGKRSLELLGWNKMALTGYKQSLRDLLLVAGITDVQLAEQPELHSGPTQPTVCVNVCPLAFQKLSF